MKLIAFCEAPADFRITRDLVDRVVREKGPAWVADVLDAAPDGIRVYHADSGGNQFFDVHHLDQYASQLGVRATYGHFDGRPGAAGALMARTVFLLVRALAKARGSVDAVLLVWDMDDRPEDRRAGLRQARDEAQAWASFRIVLGCPNPKREAWVLAGFDAADPDEADRLAELRRQLGFHPNVDAHRLTAGDEQAKRSVKRVLRALTLGDQSREVRCWLDAPLDRLRDRGTDTGLCAFLDEIEQHLVPLCRQSG
jgi:hypothetical protein